MAGAAGWCAHDFIMLAQSALIAYATAILPSCFRLTPNLFPCRFKSVFLAIKKAAIKAVFLMAGEMIAKYKEKIIVERCIKNLEFQGLSVNNSLTF